MVGVWKKIKIGGMKLCQYVQSIELQNLMEEKEDLLVGYQK